ncbi:3' terminal RNA ribose 2'-O-methyltransferase Hen1 [Deinococcus piscis]|uniref:Small RNA 2'-O-methyltransferase n=1 Tax=Deinococcus piscis TaxID=394230 RepID=A0ABQ3KA11_9DEIO|nr:3' terminal RNA ribose 2'-O-methyltransferase Hen1 [Deinococcus piscis]GHG10498.1 3' terminal RNA ribose 2'-O-methyltransferase Hen1 [Deinococcus piscis]
MLLRLTLHYSPATDLGYLLHKHPDRTFTRTLSFGQSQLFFPHIAPDRCTAVLQLEVDPVALSRQVERGASATTAPLEPYVNDRPYVSGSFMAVALKDAFGTAMSGRSKERPELAAQALDFDVELPAVAVRGEGQAEEFFGPLGYAVTATPIPLDPDYPEWDEVSYVSLRLRSTVRLQDLLAHLYVLLPALDGRKHYFVNEAEIEKLERYTADWLPTHPAREAILRGYLRFAPLVGQVREGWWAEEGTAAPEPVERAHVGRLDAVAEQLQALAAEAGQPNVSVLDLGCGEGELLWRLVRSSVFRPIVGMDLSAQSLRRAAERLHLHERPEVAARVTLWQGSLTYPDSRLHGFDLAALVEVIEHLEPHRLPAVTAQVFGGVAPRALVVTTPNAEYNQVFGAEAGLRHSDHRFEWTRAEFAAWVHEIERRYPYRAAISGVGAEHPDHGHITQMAVFRRRTETEHAQGDTA